MPRPAAIPLLLALSALGAAEPVVATPFEVRREVLEWCEEADRAGADGGGVVERAQALLAAHGRLLLASSAGARPVAEVVEEKLRARGLDQAFARVWGARAEARLAEARGEDELLVVALAHPFTPAAARAWRRLADLAWDRGRLGAYLARARRAGDAADAGLGGRVRAAAALLAAGAAQVPPASLAGLDELWRLEREARPPQPAGRVTVRRRGEPRPGQPAAPLAFSAPLGELTAVCDGLRLRLFDHLVGREVAAAQVLGNSPPAARALAPVALRDGFAAVGLMDQQRLTVLAVDRAGSVCWRAMSPPLGFNPAVSGPVAADALVCVASVDEGEGGADLMVRAWHAADGRPAWECLVARLGSGRGWMLGLDGTAAPALAVAAGELVVLSNRGLIARVTTGGQVRRLWTYPSLLDDAGAAFRRANGEQAREGRLASDGTVAVATPADAPALALVLPAEGDPQLYRGDGAAGEVVAAEAGLALLAAPATVVALDCQALRPRWAAPAPAGGGPPAGAMGGSLALVAAAQELRLYALADGRVADRRPLETPAVPALADGVLLLGADGWIAAMGTAQAVGERLAAAMAAAPDDWRPRAALASVAAARGDTAAALARWEEALARGAPGEYAEQAARLVRARLDLAAPADFPPLLARLAALGGPALAGELAWWRGRQAEAMGLPGAALDHYRAAAAAPDRLVAVRARAAVSLRLLAGLALARTGGGAPPPWSLPPAAPASAPAAAWRHEERRGRALAVAGGMAVGYADGVVSARRLADGVEAWWRRPAKPLLGVAQRGDAGAGEGIPLNVFQGTAAAAAGLKSGDLLLSFNGVDTRDFVADLVPAVMKAGVRSPFTAVVRRREQRVELTGRLGGELAEPVAANAATVLVWPTLIQGGRPEGLWFAAHDLASGAELWRHALPPATQESGPAAPLLTADDCAIAPDGADLVALAVRPGAAGEPAGRERWRLPALAGLLPRARLVGGRLLWLSDPEGGLGRLVDAADGRMLAELPADGARDPLLDGGELLVRRADGALCCFDLSRAALRWSSPGSSPALAVGGDGVWSLDAADRLQVLDRANGRQRRQLGDLGAVQAAVRIGEGAGAWLVAHHAPEAGVHALAALEAAGGAQRWSLRLPPAVELLALAADGEGVAGVAADRDALGDGEVVWFRLDRAGELVSWARLPRDPVGARLEFLAGGVLLAGSDDIAALPGAPPAGPAAPAPCPELGGAPGAATLAALPLQALGGARWGLARQDGRLVAVAAGEDLQLRLADAGLAVDGAGAELRLRAEGDPVLRHRAEPPGGAWRIESHGRGEGGLRWVVLAPPATRKPGQPLAVRAACGAASDGAGAPWWLVARWRTVAGAP